jgi:hypothetical protein
LNEYEASWQYLGQAIQIAYQSGLNPIVLEGLANLADLRFRARPSSSLQTQMEAVELLSLVINHPAGEQATRDRAARLLAEHEPALAADVIAAAIARSRSRTLETTVAEIGQMRYQDIS